MANISSGKSCKNNIMAKGNAGTTKLINVFARLISNIIGPVSVVPKKR